MVVHSSLRGTRKSAETGAKRSLGAVLVAVLLVFSFPGSGAGEEPDSEFRIDNFFEWPQSDLEVLIVPPTHGPLLGPGILPYGVDGALPTGTYLEATLAAIENWRYTIQVFAEENPQFDYLAGLEIEERVLLVDEVTPADVQNADILIVYPEHAGPVMGAATHLGSNPGPRCVAADTLWLTTTTVNHYDMYKLAGHEFGHCLGLGHTVGNSPAQDMMSQGGYPNNSYRCPSTLNMMGLVESFSRTFGQGAGGGVARIDSQDYEQICMPGLP